MPLNQHVQVEAELGGMKILLVNESTAPEDRDAVLDDFSRSIGRQQSKVDLARAVMDLLNTKREIVGYPERRVEYQKARTLERARMRSQIEMAHHVSLKRGDYNLSAPQKRMFADFDAATEQKLAEFDGNLEAKKQLVPIYEAQIERLKGIIEGKDNIEVPLQEAAEIQLLAAE